MLRKILAVDDSALIHQMYKLFLSRYKNCKLISAMNGLEALDKLGQEEGIDLILLDINMPVMNGLEFLQRVQKEPAYQAIPVIIISTEGKEEDTIRGLKMGAKGYVKKPFQASELHGLIEKITASYRIGQALSMSDFQVSPELLAIYLEDARGHLEALDHCLLALERDGVDPGGRRPVLGPLHTLKGNSGMMGFTAHQGLRPPPGGRLRAGRATARSPSTPAVFDRAVRGRHRAARRGGAGVPRGHARSRDLAAEKAALDALLAGRGRAPRPRRPLAAPAAPLGARRRRARARGAAAPRGRRPRASTAPVRGRPLQHGARGLRPARPPAEPGGRADHLPHQAAASWAGAGRAARRPRARGRELLAAVQQVAGVSAQLQETVMDIRMLPIRHVFERFPRLVRDLARQQGKEIELILEGEGTRVDKAIIDEIGEPLVHLIRNSVDHGIETPGGARGPRQDPHRHHPALRRPGVEPRRHHHHGRRRGHRRRAACGARRWRAGSSRATRR